MSLWERAALGLGPLSLLIPGVRQQAGSDLKASATELGLATAKYVGGPTVGLLSALGAPVGPPDYAAFDRGADVLRQNRAAGRPSWTPEDVADAFAAITPPAVATAGKTLLAVAAIAGVVLLVR